jgi:spore coat polysaccharide biosynthesis protein SpsF
MKKGILIQSRLSSSRLPKKMLMSLGEYKLVEFVYNRCLMSKESNVCAIITSIDKSDDELYDFCIKKGIQVFRGSLNNVLQRYIDASEFFELDIVCRVCGDSPFIDTKYIDDMFIELNDEKLDYIGFNKNTIVHGLDSEVFKIDILKSLLDEELSADDLEHVTFFIKNNLEKYKYKNIVSSFSLEEVESISFTVDYQKDLDLCKKYYQKYLNSINFTSADLINAIKKENECVV